MDKDKLIEVMAKAAFPEAWFFGSSKEDRERTIRVATCCYGALEANGIVLCQADVEQGEAAHRPAGSSISRCAGAEKATIYLMAQRKAWYHEVPEGWENTHWERFDFIECGIYTKPIADLTETDKELWGWYGKEPDGWISPAGIF
jgi:hypothetical protein